MVRIGPGNLTGVAADARRARPSFLWPLAGFAALVLALLSPALYNGSPLLSPDSVGYMRSGEASLDAAHWLVRSRIASAPTADRTAVATPAPRPDRRNDGVSTARSVFYGIPVVALYRIGGLWMIALAQVVLSILVLQAVLRRLGQTANPLRDHCAIAVAGLLGGLAVYTVTVMPDLFAGLLIPALAVFIGFYRQLSPKARLGWLALIVYAILVHKGHIAVFGVTVGFAAIAALIVRRFEARPFAALAVALAIGWAGHAAVDLAVTRMTGEAPLPTPFMLSRVVGDGTALPYLDEACPQKDLLLCRYRDRFPMTENEFLWSTAPGEGVVGHLDQADRRRLAAESNSIIIGSIARDPLAQAKVTLANMFRQNITIGVTRFGMLTGLEPEKAPGFAPALTAYRQTRVFRHELPLALLSSIITLTYLLAFIALAVLVIRRPSLLFSGEDRARALQVIVAGVLINACIFGAVSSTADRYQGRVAWLIPLVVVVLLWRSRRANPA